MKRFAFFLILLWAPATAAAPDTDGATAQIIAINGPIGPDWRTRLLRVITDPNIALTRRAV